MSSLVQAKWMNDSVPASSGYAAKQSRSQYSTALTSWFVVRSIALIASASASENASTRARSAARVPAASGAKASSPASDSAMNHSTSTWTRRCIRPYSDSSGRSAATFAA